MTAAAGHVWVVDTGGGNSVTELDAKTGGLIRVIRGSAYGFKGPDAIAVIGGHVWVANGGGNTLTELDATTGDLVRVFPE